MAEEETVEEKVTACFMIYDLEPLQLELLERFLKKALNVTYEKITTEGETDGQPG